WDQQQLSNLGAILELKQDSPSIQDLETRIKWLYHSKKRARFKAIATSIVERRSADKDKLYAVPTYSELINRLATRLKLKDRDEPVGDISRLEMDISYDIIIRSLQKMTPLMRRAFFNESVNLADILDNAGIKNPSLRGPMTTMVALGLAKTSAATSLYIASTTALGFVTHAVGITLPFAAVTGMTSTIAFVIGPPGWLAASGWVFWQVTGPKWKKLTPALMYIISTNSQIDQKLAEDTGA
ncbi:MAG: hypothetical protein WD709_03750, partial [Gammaproteobacteria bacterium]